MHVKLRSCDYRRYEVEKPSLRFDNLKDGFLYIVYSSSKDFDEFFLGRWES